LLERVDAIRYGFDLIEGRIKIKAVPNPHTVDGDRGRHPPIMHKFKELGTAHANIGCGLFDT
jgi:hypothetical protein